MARPKPKLHDESGLRLLKEMALDLAESAHNELHGKGSMNSRFTPATFEKIRDGLALKVHRMSELTGKPEPNSESLGTFHFYRQAKNANTVNDEWRLDADVDATSGFLANMKSPDFGGALDYYVEAKDHGDDPPLHGDIIAVIHSPAPGNPDISRIIMVRIGRPAGGGFEAERIPVEERSIMPALNVRLTSDEGAYAVDDGRLIAADRIFSRFGYELTPQITEDPETGEKQIVRYSASNTPVSKAIFNEAHPLKPHHPGDE